MLRQKGFSACINYSNPLEVCLSSYVCNGTCAPVRNIRGYDYVPLPHQTSYGVKVRNHHNSRARMTLIIDGKEMGVWILRPYQEVNIQRGIKEDREFVFLKENSQQYIDAGGKVGDSVNGLVKIILTPELKTQIIYYEQSSPSFMAKQSMSLLPPSSSSQSLAFSSGGAVLGDRTGQRFGKTYDIEEDDLDGQTTFIFRLVVEEPSVYVAVNGYRNVPPRIELLR